VDEETKNVVMSTKKVILDNEIVLKEKETVDKVPLTKKS